MICKKFRSLHIPFKKTPFNDEIKYAFKKLGIRSHNDIILEDKTKVKYFIYSEIDLYNRFFSKQARKSFDTNERIFADYNERNAIIIKMLPFLLIIFFLMLE